MLPQRLLNELELKVQFAHAQYWFIVVLACLALCPLGASLMRLLIWFLDALDPNILDTNPASVHFGGPVAWYGLGLLMTALSLAWAGLYARAQQEITRHDLQDHVLLSTFADEQYEMAVNVLKHERSKHKAAPAPLKKDLFAKLLHFSSNYRDYKYLASDRREAPVTNPLDPHPALDLGLALLAIVASFSFAGVAIAGPILLRILLIYPRLSAIMLAVIEELRSDGAHDAEHDDGY